MNPQEPMSTPQGMARVLAMAIGLFMTLGGVVMSFTIMFALGIPLAIVGFCVLLWGLWGFKPPEQPVS